MPANIQDNIGDDNVVIGNRKVTGNRNVIIDATDSNGNTILNRSMVIGYGAKGGKNDIIIGSNAGRNLGLFTILVMTIGNITILITKIINLIYYRNS